MALVGGANAIFSHGLTKEMTELGMLSRQGRCRTLDASADGFVRSEGCGMVVLERMDEAQAASALVTKAETCLRNRVDSSRARSRASSGPTVRDGAVRRRVSSMIGIPIHSCGSVTSTVYFDAMSRRSDRAAIKREWIERPITAHLREHIHTDGRIRRWASIPEAKGRFLRVVLLPDGETVHNAFFDREFKP